MDKLFVYIDGTARGEPGEAAVSIAITTPDGSVVEEISRLIGRTTTEVAEYRALTEACRHVIPYEPSSVVFFTHNQRLANYINGVFETREPHIKHQIEIALGLLNQLPRWRLNHVDQKVNMRAPRLVEQAFHQSLQAQATRERMELVLLARVATLSDDAMQRLLDYADRLREEE